MKEVMDTGDVAELLNVTPVTVRRWLASGEMTGAKIPGAGWRLTPADIAAYLNKHRPARGQSDDDEDAYWAEEAGKVLDRVERGEEKVWTFAEWEARHGLGG